MKALGLDSGGKKVLEEMKEQSRPSLCPYGVRPYLLCVTDRHKTIPTRQGASDTREVQRAGARVWRRGGGRVGWLCTRWHKRCTCSSSWNPASLGVWSAGFGRVLSQSFKSVPVARLERPLGHPRCSHLGLHIRGEVQCVPLQFCEGNGGVLQVVEEDLDLCHDIMGPDVRSRREVCFALHFRGSQ